MHARVVLGVGKVSCLERCPHFRGILFTVVTCYLCVLCCDFALLLPTAGLWDDL